MSKEKNAFLFSPAQRKKLWAAFAAFLLLSIIAEFFVHVHGTGIEAGFAFHAWFGFAACFVFLLLSAFLALFLKRPDDSRE